MKKRFGKVLKMKIRKQLLVLLLAGIHFIRTAHGKPTAVVRQTETTATTTTTTTKQKIPTAKKGKTEQTFLIKNKTNVDVTAGVRQTKTKTKTTTTTTKQKIPTAKKGKTEQTFLLKNKANVDATASPSQKGTMSLARGNQTTNLTKSIREEHSLNGSNTVRKKRRVDSVCVAARKIHFTAIGPITYLVCKKVKRCREETRSYLIPVFIGYIDNQQIWKLIEKRYTIRCMERRNYSKTTTVTPNYSTEWNI